MMMLTIAVVLLVLLSVALPILLSSYLRERANRRQRPLLGDWPIPTVSPAELDPVFRTGPFGQDPQWTALIAALEESLRLHHHRPGTLTKLDRYLHQRTHGMIGSLLWLIRSAAINAVLDGTEKVTKKSLDAVEADITSQTPRPPAA